jgi:hypothetical protein
VTLFVCSGEAIKKPDHAAMDILVSFCNVWTPGRPMLGVLNTETFGFQIVELPDEVQRCYGIRGLAASNRYLYTVLQETPLSPPGLLVLDRGSLRMLNHYQFHSTRDIHSISATEDLVYAVSTGTDEVIKLQVHGVDVISEAVFWRPEPGAPRADIYHLNGICNWRGNVLVSGFGKKTGQLWSSAARGFIVDISTGEMIGSQIEQPHSVVALGDTVAYCESRKMAVGVVGGHCAQKLPGYSRGLCQAGGKLFVGTSAGRRVSKSTGVINHPGDGGEPVGLCAISRLSSESLEVERIIDLSLYGDEIYDLLPVQNTQDWPLVSADSVPAFDVHWHQQIQKAREEISGLIPPDETFILIDQNKFWNGDVVAGRHRISFVERKGQYKGMPADDGAAIRELESFMESGANFIVFGWPAFWWLEHYPELHQLLRTRFHCAIDNERLIAFDLRT